MLVFFGSRRPKKTDIAATMLFAALVVIVISGFLRGCSQPYWQGMGQRKSDPCKAAHFFAIDVRNDNKSSLNSVYELTQINSTCVIPEIVGLLDIPDGKNVKDGAREALWKALERNAKTISPAIPPYNPTGYLGLRHNQKMVWEAWCKEHIR